METIKLFEEFINEANEWSFKKVKGYVEDAAKELGLSFKETKKTPLKSFGYDAGMMYNYMVGPVEVVIKNSKCPGAPRLNDVELYILTEPGSTKGRQFTSYSSAGYDTVKAEIEKKMGDKKEPAQPAKMQTDWTKAKLDSLIKDLRKREEPVDDDGLWDIAQGIFAEYDGLEDFIKKEKGVQDPLGWFVNQI